MSLTAPGPCGMKTEDDFEDALISFMVSKVLSHQHHIHYILGTNAAVGRNLEKKKTKGAAIVRKKFEEEEVKNR
ncbi:hypothetical protein OIU77_014602 [Salix suchowensis]|uniref:Uncharacterized protein n=1 Tax=Salix suchowensis TaxID=1278906 RepID=A0ABQ8ZXU8_9ROSI|nr:hypothetical protein OIU77_014602 [Salix suchowensis]